MPRRGANTGHARTWPEAFTHRLVHSNTPPNGSVWLSVALLSMLDAWLDAFERFIFRAYFVSVSLYLQLANRGHFNRLPGVVELHCITETAACGGLWAVGGRHRDPPGSLTSVNPVSHQGLSHTPHRALAPPNQLVSP